MLRQYQLVEKVRDYDPDADEDALNRAADQIRAAADPESDPLNRLKISIELLFELCRPDPAARQPLFTDFAPRKPRLRTQ